ncbi:E3 ubiquitin-protein ligase COP1-like isoform X2 [Rhodamnia argentea]|nr:E3 ubiquitin-protein ligase COP1-like isoform X2 [Rhodamnia argentea]
MQVDLQDTKEHIEATDNKQRAESLEPDDECFEKLKKFDVSTASTSPPSSVVGGSCCHCGQSIQLQSHKTPEQQTQQKKLAEYSDYAYLTGLLQEIDFLRLGSQDTSRTAPCPAMEGPVLKKEETGCDSMKREGCQSGFEDVKSMLSSFMEYSQLKVIAELNNGVHVGSRNIAASIELNKDEELFATAGISRTVEVFHFPSVLNGTAADHGPVVKISRESKLSCLSWNKYMSNQFAVSDYEGIVAVHDAATCQSMIQFNEHENRVWSIDFSHTEPHLLISGGNGRKVKVWSTKQEASVLTINMKTSICAVKYDPGSSVYFAVGSADHNIHYYDSRNISRAVHKLKGHRKSVSHVEFSSSNNLISASIDSSLRLWDIEKRVPLREFTGHLNKKNFAGLSSTGNFIACGSETNEVVVYHKDLPKPVAWHSFNSPHADHAGENADSPFVSAVCWKHDGSAMLAANSQGIIKVLALPFQQIKSNRWKKMEGISC